jgi:L-lysine exporter family protein LysE/ArgO
MFNIINDLLITLALFIGIGPQNLNTISHAIKKNYPYFVATTCFISDALLILIGCIAVKINSSSILITIINIICLVFICYYLIIKSIKITKEYKKYKIDTKFDDLKTSIIRALLLTWLNPLVIIDTIIIIGGISNQYSHNNWYLFLFGAVLGDAIWHYGISFIAIKLSNKLNKPQIWWLLNILISVHFAKMKQARRVLIVHKDKVELFAK